MARNNVFRKRYLSYLINTVCNPEYPGDRYHFLFEKLYSKPFYAVNENDENRIVDAIDFRAEYEQNNGIFGCNYLGEISVLEVMVALAVRCEDTIMGNFDYGDRTAKWFWYMVYSMGLLNNYDEWFDENEVDQILNCMLSRDYERDGYGGLFYIPGIKKDLRKVEIWYQMNWWLDTVGE